MNLYSFQKMAIRIAIFFFMILSDSRVRAIEGDSDSTSQSNKQCRLNSKLLDDRNIEATRHEIDVCNDIPISCDFARYSKYRTIDGSCNNLEHPYWGKSNTCLQRILPFDYADGKSAIKESCTGNQLPNARHVSNVFHRTTRLRYDEFTTHMMEWGQIFSHDLSLNDIFKTPESNYTIGLFCCETGPVINDTCLSIPVPPNDPYYPSISETCISYARTTPCQCQADGVETRYHLNQNTAYHDLSVTYGSTDENARSLRAFKIGMLKTEYSPMSGPMPPTVEIEENCFSPPNEEICYHSGDARTNQTPFLLTNHIYWIRNHNNISHGLRMVNPHWDDERLFQEARRINIATAQYITYKYYLPLIVGQNMMYRTGLAILEGPRFTKYDRNLDATITNEVQDVAQRYGHSQIPSTITETDPITLETNYVQTSDFYYQPRGFRTGQFERTAKGMTFQKAMERDKFLGDGVRNMLFKGLFLGNYSIDLAAVSILRGREHGIPGYSYYLRKLFNARVRNFQDLKELQIMADSDVDLLAGLYESVHDVDLYSAGFAEYHVEGGLVGPTFANILVEKYYDLKYGDRYWFEHGNQAGSFTPAQLMEIKGGIYRAGSVDINPLSRILCETTQMRYIQANVFIPPNRRSPYISCDFMPKFNFFLWKE